MENDTVECSTSGHIKQVTSQAVTEESQVKAFHCSHCVLIFKSKVYLFEHLNKVHGLNTETSLREAGLCPGTDKANTENSSSSSGDHFKCQSCDFKACSWDGLSEHEELCHKTSENLNMSGGVIISENLDSTLSVISANQNNEAAGTSEDPSVLSDISTSETKCTLKDLKTYKRPLQTITKYFSVSSGSNTMTDAKLADGTKGTIILQESPSSSCPNSSGVFKVTAKSVIDITGSKSYHFLHTDLTTDLTPSKTPEQFRKETVPDSAVKRSSGKSSKGHPAKKAKLDNEEMLTEKENESRQQSSSSNEFSFEVSEDEDEADAPKVYSCKHCDYSDVGIRRISAHYQNEHPYIRYNSVYIQDSSDHSATFRCLECPVEFLSTADLKRHYLENHPDAPDVFAMKSCGLSLVFKCFLCKFTTNLLKSLKEHYKAKHATYEVENSLLFCRYSVSECQEESSQLSLEKSGGISPERAHTSQNSSSESADLALYKCQKCMFSHKSVVVMHVHYQKSHPDEVITLDKIKQSACATSHAALMMTSEKCSDSVIVVDPSETTPEACKNHSQSSQTTKGKSLKIPTKSSNEITTGLDNLSSSLPNETFYCQFCSYTSTKVKSILGHHNAKHSMDAPIGTDDVLWYSAEMQKLQSESKMSKSPSSFQFNTIKQVKMCREKEDLHKEDHTADASETGERQDKSYACPENLFYCHKCNFGNPSIKGVINHQAKVHRKCNSSTKCVLEYTALIHDEIRKAKANAKDSSSSHLPLPIINEGEEKAFFCHFCNYRHSTLDQVMRHYSKTHHGFKAKPSEVLLHTSKIHDQAQKSPLTSTQKEEAAQEPLKKKKKTKRHSKSLVISATPSVTTPQTKRSLNCNTCGYNTDVIYALKKHLSKTHKVKRTVTDILRYYFRQGSLEPGHYCEFCVFRHEKAAVVYEHYQERHLGRVPSVEYVSTWLYAGPGMVLPKKKKPNLEQSEGNGTENSLLSQRSGQNKAGLSCKRCSFKSKSLSDLAHHYRIVHPLGPKPAKKANTSWRVEDQSDRPGSSDSYQVTLEFGKSRDEAEASSTVFKCIYCSANFSSQHGLQIHCGMKHPEFVIEKYEEQQKPKKQLQKPKKQLQKRLHVFKCPYCTYVNTIYQGVLTHCQMKHPNLPSRANSLHVDMVYVENLDKTWKSSPPGESLKLCGHMCKTCPQICATLEKLNKHCERDHKKTGASTAQSTAKPAPKPLVKSKTLVSKAYSTHGSVSKTSFLSKKIYAVINCQHCSYTCTTKFALGRHLLANHKHTISKDCVYKCVLCSKVYFRKKHLGGHYAVTHGKEAYLKYYVPVYKQALKKTAPSPSEDPSTQQQENASETFKSSITAEESLLIYKCPKCPYVNASYHGTLTHCQMKHPAIVVRADELETGEVFASNMVKCTLGKGSNERGYLCKNCSQIHGSLTKLNAHCKKVHHDTEVYEHTDTESQPVHTSQGSAQEDASVKNKTSREVSIAENRQAPQTETPDACPSTLLAGVRSNKQLYKCQMCTYKGLYRKYLQCHYKNTHKLDAVSIYKLLEKYNKRKWNFPSNMLKSGNSTKVKCLKCPDLTFESSQLLIDHYSTFHRSEWKLDFTVLSLGSPKKKTTGVYKCDHCNTQLNGIRKVCYHMDRHRARMLEMAKAAQRKESLVSTTIEQESSEPCRQDETATLETVNKVNRWNGTPVPSAAFPAIPPQSPSELSDVQQPELESNEDKHTCKQCGRMFMSLKGLHSHEHSHAALAAIKKLDNSSTSGLKHNISKYLIHKSGTLRPFLCSCCTYRTTVFGLWRSHFMKKHRDLIMGAAETEDKDESEERFDKEFSNSSEKINSLPEIDEEPELIKGSLYLEPPDVRRQLNHYTMMAQSSIKSKVNVQLSKLPENSVLHCEICNFSTGHLSSIRRHYLNRHGKKIFRCKDCNFFTGLRKTLEMHMETGHSTCQSKPTHQKDLCCPFCLYQTKNKNNMIDHIVLHREERVVPIEVRRPKLSRYLQGIIFRCHKCTFTSGSPENLRLHMMRHDDIKPYKCRLCYFDCTRLSDLEAHLSDKHQVVRNHELVGQVSLDQLEASVGRVPVTEEKHLSNMDQLDKEREDVEMEDLFADCDEVPQAENLEENYTTEKSALQMRECQESNGESPGETSESDIQHENAKPNSTVQQELQEQAETVLRETAREHETGNVEQSVAEVKITDTPCEDCNGPEEERQINENQTQPKFTECGDKQQAETGNDFKVDEETPAQKQDVKALERKTLNIEPKVEDDILCHILQLANDDSKMHNKADEGKTVKMEKGTEASDASDIPLAKESNFPLFQNPKSQVGIEANSPLTKLNIAHVNNTRTKESLKIERHMLTLPPTCERLKMITGDILGVSFTKLKREQVHTQKGSEQEPKPCKEIPVLEKECLKKEVHSPECFKEEKEKGPFEQKQNQESEMLTEDEERHQDQAPDDHDGMKDDDCLQEREDTTTQEPAEVLCSSLTEQKRFTCEFCGRNLVNSSELKRHVMRHGI
ncbi:zinc finger protein 462-like [Oreochromis aureus]|uniref:zinc finger protein 462-like n=1 Tax=Oreochromis aureus TaxID=47969 RepID=UPI0019539B0F|nr:zinc finger protein 462-like [Oreochromis aureus]XP_039476730.1 zinc finger protein 462-like [Oreochromis aureus]XP_039476731.1 zinc finger protein 462-like [Oreochromis aureus]